MRNHFLIDFFDCVLKRSCVTGYYCSLTCDLLGIVFISIYTIWPNVCEHLTIISMCVDMIHVHDFACCSIKLSL